MSPTEIDEYRKTAKVGDRLGYGTHSPDVWHVQEVHERGVVVSLNKTHADHRHLLEWSYLAHRPGTCAGYPHSQYTLIHKEP